MNTEQLETAKKTWEFSMEITLRNGRIYVANSGYITDDVNDITAKKHSGYFNGFYYQFKKKGDVRDLIAVIKSISVFEVSSQEVTA
jgi:hypothetical protein